jgi:pimeloyl-ACP methyl ester carboxylesterase
MFTDHAGFRSATTAPDHGVPSAQPPDTVPSRRARFAPAALLLTGSSVAVLVASDGTPPWQVTRGVLVVAAVVALATISLRPVPVLRGGLCFGVGLIAAAGGAGIALPHVAAAGPVLPTAAGTVAFLGGLILLVYGAAVLVHRVRVLWRLPLILALLATAYVGLFSGFVAVKATNVPPGPLGSAVPADHGLRSSDVTFRTADGVVLSGWYVPSRNGAAVVVAHGSGSTRSAVLGHAAVLARHGYGVLLYDARGHGLSSGRAMDLGWFGDHDLTAATSFVLAQPDVREGQVAVVGLSLGGEEAIGAAAADPRIRAVVAEGATGRTAADLAWLSDRYGARGWIQERINDLTYGVTDLLTDARPPRDLRGAAAAAAPRPILLITAGSVADESYAGQHIRAGAPSTVDLWTLPGSGHTGALATDPVQWERHVVTFLSTALQRR